jgi:preprotein translocase subunit Sss1
MSNRKLPLSEKKPDLTEWQMLLIILVLFIAALGLIGLGVYFNVNIQPR